MISTAGKALAPEIKQVIVRLKHYFDDNKLRLNFRDSSVNLTAEALEISIATINRVMAHYRKDPESINATPKMKGRPRYSLDASHETMVRAYIRQANMDGHYITLETIRDFLKESPSKGDFHLSTLARTLDRWGFEFGKGTRSQHLKEKDHIIVLRQRYLRKMRENRLNGGIVRPEVYLDESYVNKNHSNDFIWYSGEDGPWVQKPTGKGERLIIMNAMTHNGWIPNAKLVFKSTRKTGDYHGQMNADLFKKWFSNKLLPNLSKPSIIVMDNATYHNTLSSHSAPTPSCAKAKIRDWLEANKIPCRDDCLKVELVEVLKKVGPAPAYVIDELAEQHGHEVVRTPPYHPELQPIETCWAVIKNDIARNCEFTLKNLEENLEKAFKKVTAKTCRGIIKKIRETEEAFWEEDAREEKRTH